jgi:hypothetical protein
MLLDAHRLLVGSSEERDHESLELLGHPLCYKGLSYHRPGSDRVVLFG